MHSYLKQALRNVPEFGIHSVIFRVTTTRDWYDNEIKQAVDFGSYEGTRLQIGRAFKKDLQSHLQHIGSKHHGSVELSGIKIVECELIEFDPKNYEEFSYLAKHDPNMEIIRDGTRIYAKSGSSDHFMFKIPQAIFQSLVTDRKISSDNGTVWRLTAGLES